MSRTETARLMVDLATFAENQRKIPLETLAEIIAPYRGMQVAWNAEGTSIVAGGETHDVVLAQLEALGLSAEAVVFHYIDRMDEAYL